MAIFQTVSSLAELVGGVVSGNGSVVVGGVSSIEEATEGDVVFAENSRFFEKADRSLASAIVCQSPDHPSSKPLILVTNPRQAFSDILEAFAPRLERYDGIHPSAAVGEGVVIGHNVSLGANVVVGHGCKIGDGVTLAPGVVLGTGCEVGANSILHSNVTLYANSVLGERCILHSGVVIGADGFGFVRIGNESRKVPHLGTVEIGNDVEIGANSAIDRAKTGKTVIGDRVKIDNLVHIGHNCKIGSDSIVVAQVGIAGSATIGRGVILAGQAGVNQHVTIGDGCIIMGRAAVFNDVKAGTQLSGYPGIPHRDRLRVDASVLKLPDYLKRVRALEVANTQLVEQNQELREAIGKMAAKLGMDI